MERPAVGSRSWLGPRLAGRGLFGHPGPARPGAPGTCLGAMWGSPGLGPGNILKFEGNYPILVQQVTYVGDQHLDMD